MPDPIFPLPESNQAQCTNNTQPHHRPPTPNNRLIRKAASTIPNQMPNPINRMKCEWQRQQTLRRNLGHDWPTRKRRCHARTAQIPSDKRGDQVRGTENIESARENGARETVGDGEDPGDLPLVD